METEIETLKKQVITLQKENKSLVAKSSNLTHENEALQSEIKSLKQKTASSSMKNRYSAEFWQDIESKLKNDTDSIKSLIKNGTITMNDVSDNGSSLLHLAASHGNYDIVQLCINLGADLKYTTDGWMDTPLFRAHHAKAHHVEQLLTMNEMNASVGDRINKLSKDINKQNGITENILNELNGIGDQTKEIFHKTLSEILINIISKRLIFSDDLLNLCWKLEEEKFNGDPLKSELWQNIAATLIDIIENGNSNKRDWFWIKKCIITSNIWFNEIENTETDTKEEKTETETETETDEKK
eukprot:477870_1